MLNYGICIVTVVLLAILTQEMSMANGNLAVGRDRFRPGKRNDVSESKEQACSPAQNVNMRLKLINALSSYLAYSLQCPDMRKVTEKEELHRLLFDGGKAWDLED